MIFNDDIKSLTQNTSTYKCKKKIRGIKYYTSLEAIEMKTVDTRGQIWKSSGGLFVFHCYQ